MKGEPILLGRKRTDELVVADEMMHIREDCTLVDEQGLVFSLCSGTRAFTVLVDGVRRGLVFLGRGDYALNSEIRIHGARFSKLYSESFEGWGVILTDEENWSRLETLLDASRAGKPDTSDGTPQECSEAKLAEKAREELASLIGDWEDDLSAKIGWRFKVRTSKGTTSLSLRKGRYAYSSPDAKLAVADQDTLSLREGGLSLSLKGDKVAMKTEGGRVTVASSGNKIAMVSPDGGIAAAGGLLGEKGPDALQIVSEEIAKIGYTPS